MLFSLSESCTCSDEMALTVVLFALLATASHTTSSDYENQGLHNLYGDALNIVSGYLKDTDAVYLAQTSTRFHETLRERLARKKQLIDQFGGLGQSIPFSEIKAGKSFLHRVNGEISIGFTSDNHPIMRLSVYSFYHLPHHPLYLNSSDRLRPAPGCFFNQSFFINDSISDMFTIWNITNGTRPGLAAGMYTIKAHVRVESNSTLDEPAMCRMLIFNMFHFNEDNSVSRSTGAVSSLVKRMTDTGPDGYFDVVFTGEILHSIHKIQLGFRTKNCQLLINYIDLIPKAKEGVAYWSNWLTK
eukprot:960763_1